MMLVVGLPVDVLLLLLLLCYSCYYHSYYHYEHICPLLFLGDKPTISLVDIVVTSLRCYDNRVSLNAKGWRDLRCDFLQWLYALRHPRLTLHFFIAYYDDSHVLYEGGRHRIQGEPSPPSSSIIDGC